MGAAVIIENRNPGLPFALSNRVHPGTRGFRCFHETRCIETVGALEADARVCTGILQDTRLFAESAKYQQRSAICRRNRSLTRDTGDSESFFEQSSHGAK